jgi:Ca-activated chloride channel family protein
LFYASEAYTKKHPVTSDKPIILEAIKSIKYDTVFLQDGTGIGMGLANRCKPIKDSKSKKSKVIILLTDGVNNLDSLSPKYTSNIAKQYGIRVYTVELDQMEWLLSPTSFPPQGKLLFADEGRN